MILRDAVQSSTITSVGYDTDTQTLEIEFKRGGVYQYMEVPKDVYEEFISEGSMGQFFNTFIRDYYTSEKLY